MDLSIVIPLYNEEESLPELCAWIRKVVEEQNYSYEIILVDDGSNDKSWEVIKKLGSENNAIKAIRFRRNYGKSAALNVGFEASSGDVVITMDADLQDSPDEIPGLYRMIKEDGYDLVSGWKKVRHDPSLSKNIPSKLYNWMTSKMSGVKLHDHNCGIKSYRRSVVKSVEVYGEMHRYIPVIAKWAGFKKIGEKVVEHRKRKYGTTKFGMNRFMNGPLDLMSIMFVSRFGKKPMHLFGTMGTIIFVLGFIAALYIGIQKLYYLHIEVKAPLVTNSPYFYLALVAMILGTQLFLTGFLAEMVARSSSERNKYHIEENFNID
ncbi:MAG TPA: glycosyltransferase family 2 protein [Bacteroidales bacterium]|nr:glycosyltransferase family 2 protein [Bacteroidales bacterium]HPI29979.1 glycosyltransferase family 2 protein [Bacteroidales bacterium]HQN16498.1 glycosyltransferase family 2 protein [Bacteroidales bacterium]HQP16162.1 glycosyltransferase family 2 protein [Bacteroidales bacterium]